MNLKEELYRITDSLRRERLDYAICGAMAVIIHGHPRATRDIDILIRADDLQRAKQVLEAEGYTLSSGIIPFDVGQATERRLYRVTKVEGQDYLTLDLLLVTPFLEDVWTGRERHLVDDREIVVVSREGLAKMKRAAGRLQDLADLSQLGLEEQQ